jgi:hypothetical protein
MFNRSDFYAGLIVSASFFFFFIFFNNVISLVFFLIKKIFNGEFAIQHRSLAYLVVFFFNKEKIK